MKKILLTGLILLAGLPSIYAQQHLPCGTDPMMQQALQNDPSLAARRAQLEQFTMQYVQQNQGQRTAGTILYVIPVVFHVIHNYGPENISKAQILDGVEKMNMSFQNLFGDSMTVCSIFRPLIADVQVEFRLAQIDENGNCTDGITRTVSTLTYAGDDQVKSLVQWPSHKYFNIWVVDVIASGAAGYAYLPGVAPGIDGVVMRDDYVGSIGTSDGSNYTERSLTHEAGHWLNLSHTWGAGNNPGLPQNCSGSDFVSDTPTTIGVNDFSCDTTQVTCSTVDNVQNYMDYASCHYMFTEGQKLRMHSALNNTQGNRNNLHTQANLIATGTNDGFVPPPCQPISDFNTDVRYICEGTSITFLDLSWRADITNWQWDVPGGTPSISNDQHPVIQYNTPGVYDVTLTVSNGGLSDSKTASGIIIVTPATGTNSVPFSEDFENTGPIPSGYNWIVENPLGNAWELSTTASVSGSTSMRLLNHSGNPNGTVDEFVSPGYDLTNIVSANMTFQVAFAPRSSGTTDQLKVFASNNCGQQWNIRYTKTGMTLATTGIIVSSFVPNSSQWRQENVSISGASYNHEPNVRFKFQYSQNTGNNIYIDDINVTGTSTVGVQDVEFLATVSVYPNPAKGPSNIDFNLAEASAMKIEVTDITGRITETVENNKLAAGSHHYTFGESLNPGIYFVKFTVGDNDFTRKVIFTN